MSPSILPEPTRPNSLPVAAQWLSGIGAGSWFYLSELENALYRLQRFDDTGVVECDHIMEQTSDTDFIFSQPFTFTYLSHCTLCTVLQRGEKHIFSYLGAYKHDKLYIHGHSLIHTALTRTLRT